MQLFLNSFVTSVEKISNESTQLDQGKIKEIQHVIDIDSKRDDASYSERSVCRIAFDVSLACSAYSAH